MNPDRGRMSRTTWMKWKMQNNDVKKEDPNVRMVNINERCLIAIYHWILFHIRRWCRIFFPYKQHHSFCAWPFSVFGKFKTCRLYFYWYLDQSDEITKYLIFLIPFTELYKSNWSFPASDHSTSPLTSLLDSYWSRELFGSTGMSIDEVIINQISRIHCHHVFIHGLSYWCCHKQPFRCHKLFSQWLHSFQMKAVQSLANNIVIASCCI